MHDQIVERYEDPPRMADKPDGALQQLEQELKGVADAIDGLADRLSPILKIDHPPSEETWENTENRLRTAVATAAALRSRIAHLTSRVDL